MQIIVSRSAHLFQPGIPDQTEYGRHIHSGRLIPNMVFKSAKLTLVKKSSFCKCKRGKCLRGFSYGKCNIRFTVSCICRANPDWRGKTAQLQLEVMTQMRTNHIIYVLVMCGHFMQTEPKFSAIARYVSVISVKQSQCETFQGWTV